MASPIDSRSGGNALIAVAIVAAAFIVSWGGSGDQPRYQLTASDSAAYRMDTDSGELIACVPTGCTRVEAPDRAKTLGPFSLSIGGGDKAEPKRQVTEQNEVQPGQP